MLWILIADDHAIVRKGLMQLLRDEIPEAHLGEAGTGHETLDQLRQGGWNLLILDINMPDRSGVDILKHVQASYPDTRVLILSGLPEKQYAVNLLRAGARGYMNKEMAPEELVGAVRVVMDGRRYVGPALADLLVTGLGQDADTPAHADLSGREFQIFCKLATGVPISDIAAQLCLSAKTVSTYRSRILEKMGFSSNADITAYALRNRLID